MKLKLLLVIIIIQISAIIFLFFIIKNKANNILGVSVNKINSESIDRSSTGELKYFYEPKPNSSQEIHKDWLPYVPKYTINSDSLNERFDYPLQKEEKTFRIITLGDSFTFGQNVSTEYNWTELLEDYLNVNNICPSIDKYEVINLGVYAYDTQYEVERYKLRGVKYKPDLVIWTFTDFERNLEQTMPDIEKYETTAEELEKEGKYYENWKIAKENLMKKIGKDGAKKYQFEQITKFYQYYEGKLLFVALPNYSEYIDLLKNEAKLKQDSYFFQPSLKYEDKQYFLPDSHFNNAGHKKMMEEIVGFLKENKLLPCGN